ncbi:two-component system response regulator [Pacificimonas flava]|uniref:Two-component system response regulator n=2 Tax=Pacificimonas TaxID=1960290 RepID=A0A219B2Y3_9SPHN|nr:MULTISPECIES: ActR/PrrA/RegA family redox response regulator transcription factor [Pacificimonas]MBZ6377642.1 ActR/PrrA/RegA family redox response regulator transcription factor [Pacificimonas aurantium]OWV32671.1 two-component system response regulator [Pacificimonas flava]
MSEATGAAPQDDTLPATGKLLLVDDDQSFRQRLELMLTRKGYEVFAASSVAEARTLAAQAQPTHAVLDMKLDDGTGLDLVTELRSIRPDIRIVMLTGYGNLTTAVAAIKAGALDYLAKPADPDDIIKALSAEGDDKPEPPEDPMSADRVRWEHIQRVYELCDRNVSETARRLKMHRRTLQRILAKRSPR